MKLTISKWILSLLVVLMHKDKGKKGITTYSTPESPVRGLMLLVQSCLQL